MSCNHPSEFVLQLEGNGPTQDVCLACSLQALQTEPSSPSSRRVLDAFLLALASTDAHHTSRLALLFHSRPQVWSVLLDTLIRTIYKKCNKEKKERKNRIGEGEKLCALRNTLWEKTFTDALYRRPIAQP